MGLLDTAGKSAKDIGGGGLSILNGVLQPIVGLGGAIGNALDKIYPNNIGHKFKDFQVLNEVWDPLANIGKRFGGALKGFAQDPNAKDKKKPAVKLMDTSRAKDYYHSPGYVQPYSGIGLESFYASPEPTMEVGGGEDSYDIPGVSSPSSIEMPNVFLDVIPDQFTPVLGYGYSRNYSDGGMSVPSAYNPQNDPAYTEYMESPDIINSAPNNNRAGALPMLPEIIPDGEGVSGSISASTMPPFTIPTVGDIFAPGNMVSTIPRNIAAPSGDSMIPKQNSLTNDLEWVPGTSVIDPFTGIETTTPGYYIKRSAGSVKQLPAKTPEDAAYDSYLSNWGGGL